MTIQEMETKLNEAANLIEAVGHIFNEVLSEFDYPGVDFDEIQSDLLAMFPDEYGDYADASSFVSTYGELLEQINSDRERDYDDEENEG